MKKSKCFRLIVLVGLLPLLSLLASCKGKSSTDILSQNKPLVFGSLPDPHTGDYAIEEECYIQPKIAGMFGYMQKRGCELVLVPGDWAGGHWEQEGWVKKWGEDPEKRILPLCEKVHSCWLKHCTEFNLKPIVAPGDHEYGDNPWPENTGRAIDFPFYRKGFGLAFNIDENGNSRHNGTIGDVPQRPVGTAYENTSFAEIHKNVLFVSLDLFRFDGPSVNLGWTQGATGDSNIKSQGTVSGELTTDQETWLDAVLTAGNKDENIDFIIVQSHLPVIFPIFMHASSAMSVRDGENSSLWKLLKKHKVDFYIAGEVHAVTVTMEKETTPVHFVHGIRTFGIWTALDNTITVELFDEKDVTNCLGTLTVTKKDGEKNVEASGAMIPLHLNDLLVHYTFDNPEQDNLFRNTGAGYAKQMDGYGFNTGQTEGIVGQAIFLNAFDSSHVVSGVEKAAVILTGIPRSLTGWIKTSAEGVNTVLSLGSSPAMGINMVLENGKLVLNSMDKNVLTAESEKINDDKWHHVAITYKGIGPLASESKLYIDGKEVNATAGESPEGWERTHNDFVVGAKRTQVSSKVLTFFPVKKTLEKPARAADLFTGSIDDAAAWYGALTDTYINAIFNVVMNSDLKYNAAEMKSVFRAFEMKTEASAGGKTWKYSKCPKGNPGDVLKVKKGYYIILNKEGYGVMASL